MDSIISEIEKTKLENTTKIKENPNNRKFHQVHEMDNPVLLKYQLSSVDLIATM